MGKYLDRIKAADRTATEASDVWEAADDKAGRKTDGVEARASERANANVVRAVVGLDPK